jgi:hypothetical protein
MTDQPRTLGIQAESGSYAATGSRVELWKYGTFAPAWFADAKQQITGSDDNARPREIIFAVCAIESYLFEWVRNEALKGEFKLLAHYFPVDQGFMGITKRWKQVINHLFEDGTIPGKPNFGEQYWKEFTELVDFRNGLVHGGASRPDSDGVAEAERPEPTMEQLTQCAPGWAVRVVADVIKKLHGAVGTSPPEWINT